MKIVLKMVLIDVRNTLFHRGGNCKILCFIVMKIVNKWYMGCTYTLFLTDGNCISSGTWDVHILCFIVIEMKCGTWDVHILSSLMVEIV